MGAQKFANNASALLAASIDDNDLSIQVAGGYGALYPSPGAGEYFLVTLENDDGDIEIVKITSRATDLLTVGAGGRGMEGTSAQSWTNGLTRVEVRLTKGTMESWLQREGDTMDGDLDMQDNDIVDANITGESTFTGTEIVDTPLRGATGDDSNEISVPPDGTRATAGGAKILVEGDDDLVGAAAFDIGMIMMWYGAAVDCPDGWAICNGAGGTPDMRDKFPVGAGTSYALGDTGGATTASGVTGASGGHTPTGSAESHVLTEAELPSHKHFIAADVAYSGGGEQPLTNANQLYENTDGGPGGDTQYVLRGTATAATIGLTSAVGSGTGHTHTLSLAAVADHTHTLASIATLPPYKALHFIMYVG